MIIDKQSHDVTVTEETNEVTVNDTLYTAAPYTITVEKEATKEVTKIFTNLVPGDYKVIVEDSQCVVLTTPSEDPTVTVPPGGNTGDSDTNNGTGTNTGSNNGTNAGTNTGTNTESNNGTNTGTNSGTGTNTGGATTNTGTNSNTGSNQNVSGAGSTAKPNTNRLPQTDVDSSTGYLQLLGVLVLAVAVFIFVRRRQLNK